MEKTDKAWPAASTPKSTERIASQREKEEQIAADLEAQRQGTPLESEAINCNCGNEDGKYGGHKW